jgi:uncharacterized Zn finger protein (UPF0148 family)
VTDQQDDIEDDVDAPKCRACGVPWTRHRGIIAICQQYLETVETLERVTSERDEAREERDQAIKQRDEARREACERTGENLALLGSNARLATLREEHAARRGWDCFKDAKP